MGWLSSCLLPAVSNRGKIRLVDHEAHASRSPTVAGTLLEAPQPETIIVGQFFTGLDAAQGIEPNALTHDHRLTVRYAAVIEEAGRIPRHAAVDIIGLVERKEAGIAVLEFGQAFGFPIVIRKFWRLRKNGGHHPMPFPKSLSFIIAHNELMRF